MASVYPFVREPYAEEASETVIDIAEPGMPMVMDGVRITEAEDVVEVDFNPGGEDLPREPSEAGFYDNLAEYLPEVELQRIGQLVCDGVKADLRSRSEWLERFRKGMELLGTVEPKANLGVLKHAKEVNHPVIAEALVQYQARAVAEAFPPDGPVKAIVLGKKIPEREAQADRVQGYMNYQLLVEDRAYFAEADQGFFLLGLEGSVFKKVCRDELAQRNVSRLVMARDFVVPYSATSLETTPRYTHILPYSQNDVRKLQEAGFYRRCTLDLPTGEPDEGRDAAIEAQDELEGKAATNEIQEDLEHQIYEQKVDLDIPRFEDVNQWGEKTGIGLPYIVHVDRDSQKVLAIYRNWKEEDALRRNRVRFAQYKYLPGPGFYGFGLVHMLGGLGAAATGILRLLLVTAAFAGAGGGVKTKEGGKLSGSLELEPGVFKDHTDASFDDLKKAFWQPDFKQPPEALFRVLGLLVEAGQRFASTTEAMVGDSPTTGPVGTMVAVIEQGSKVFSGIHKRSHMAAGDEYRMLAELDGEYLPAEGYPYDVPGETRQVFREDFDDRVDVVPVSDPNIFSATQRIAVAQSLLQMAKEYPDEVSRTEAVKRMVQALRVPDSQTLLIRKDVPRADPVSENALLLIAKPVRAYPDQDHASHMQVVGALMQDEKVPEHVKAAAAAHYAEHQALQWMAEASQAMGMPMLPLAIGAAPGEPMTAAMPAQMERMVSSRAAQAINKLKPPQPSPELAQVQGDLKLKEMRMQGELKIQATRAQAEAKLAASRAKLEIALERQVAFAKLALDRELAIRDLQKQGELDQARQRQEALDTERTAVEGGVTQANSELDQAVKALAEGMNAVVAMMEQDRGAG